MAEDKEAGKAAVKEAEKVVRLGVDFSKLPDGLGEQLSIQEESDERIRGALQTLADDRDSVLLCFLTPFGAKRVTAYEIRSASIGFFDELSIEKAIYEVRKRIPGEKPKLILLLNTYGGAVNSSYAIAKMLRENFSRVTVFIPHTAASGGTLIALGGNEIFMGMNSRLSPIDTQMPYGRGRVSAQSIDRAIDTMNELLEKKRVDEIPFVYQEMTGKLDPVLWEEWKACLYQVGSYARELLTAVGYDKTVIDGLIYRLTWTPYPHDFYIGRDRAKKWGLNVREDTDDSDAWLILRSWHSIYTPTSGDKHVVRYLFPKAIQAE